MLKNIKNYDWVQGFLNNKQKKIKRNIKKCKKIQTIKKKIFPALKGRKPLKFCNE